jgi:transcriptional regulator with XRE-family HTH domain
MQLGGILRDNRLARGLSLEATAEQAGCSTSYVHKLELDQVKSPSPRVLDRLAKTLSINYSGLMAAAGYKVGSSVKPTGKRAPRPPSDEPTNATILRVLLDIRREVASVKALLAKS